MDCRVPQRPCASRSTSPRTWKPALGGYARKYALISSNAFVGVSCRSDSLCFAFDTAGNLYASTNLAFAASAWTIAYVDRTGVNSGVTGVSCPSASSCIAVDAAGNVLLGSPPPTRAQLRALLYRQLLPSGHAARIGVLLRHGGYSLSFIAPTAGRVVISWYLVPNGVRLAAHGPQPVLIATVSGRFATLSARQDHTQADSQGEAAPHRSQPPQADRYGQLHTDRPVCRHGFQDVHAQPLNAGRSLAWRGWSRECGFGNCSSHDRPSRAVGHCWSGTNPSTRDCRRDQTTAPPGQAAIAGAQPGSIAAACGIPGSEYSDSSPGAVSPWNRFRIPITRSGGKDPRSRRQGHAQRPRDGPSMLSELVRPRRGPRFAPPARALCGRSSSERRAAS